MNSSPSREIAALRNVSQRLLLVCGALSPLLLNQCDDGATSPDDSFSMPGPDGGIGSPASDTGVGADTGASFPPSGGGPGAGGGFDVDAGSADRDAAAADATASDAQPPASGSQGSLPPATDLQKPGPFTPTRVNGPSGYVLFYPTELGKGGVKHPIVSWGPGAVENAGIFSILLNHLASHGFAVISYDGTPQGQELVTGIDWMVAENARSGSVFYQKLDTSKITAGGHSAGSLATFKIGADPRLTTTMHISGGTFDPHTDINNLHAPALFICGEPGGDGLLAGDVANPNCQIDFDNAKVPVFYGITKGAAHMTPTDIGDAALRLHQLGAMVGWLRWQLAGDQKAKNMFVGSACTLCTDAAWSTKLQKSLN